MKLEKNAKSIIKNTNLLKLYRKINTTHTALYLISVGVTYEWVYLILKNN